MLPTGTFAVPGVICKDCGAGSVPVRFTCTLLAEIFPAISVALAAIRLTPTPSEMLQEKLPLETTAAAPLHVADETPDRESETVPVTVTGLFEVELPSAGELITNAAGVLSIFSVTLVEPVSPFASVAVPLTTTLLPSVDTVCGPGQLVTGELPGMHVNVTVTFVLFHPAPFGAGDLEAVIHGAVPTTNGVVLLPIPDTVT